MCGIAGWFSAAPIRPEQRPRLGAMVDAIIHRGPDDRAEWFEDHAALGHARLSVIDLEGGRQPLTDATGAATIVFNGEIYNYEGLRRDLEAAGCRFATRSDTEVILNLYLAEGPEGFARLRGMYAFAIWDGRAGSAILVRDPVGVKPLFYAEPPDGGLVFGSEAKAIAARDGGGAALDEASLHLLMNFRYLPGERSLFRGIRQVPPGGILRWSRDGRLRTSTVGPYPGGVVEGPLAALEDATGANLTADVEVATYLSGGIDSAAVTAIARRRTGRAVRTFTLDVGDDPAEADNAARTAALLGVENLRSDCPAEMERTLPWLVWHLEVPKINAFQASENARAAAAHVKVALSGLGGDELFLGYNVHGILARAASVERRTPALARRGAAAIGLRLLRLARRPDWSEGERALRMAAELGNWPRVYGLLRNLWDDPARRRRIYGPRLLDAGLPDAFEHLETLWPAGPDPVRSAADFEWRHKLVNDFLWQEDRASMAHGLEVRVPFLDPVLAREVARLDRATLMPGGRQKGYLRKLVAPLLPAEILRRPKSGFQVDAPSFFKSHLRRAAARFLAPEKIREHGLFDPGFVASVLRLPAETRHRWHYFMLYLVLSTHVWVELFEGRTLSPGTLLG